MVKARGFSLAKASKAIDRNHSYLQQFCKYQKPARLPEPERYKLARFLEVNERDLRDDEYGSQTDEMDNAVADSEFSFDAGSHSLSQADGEKLMQIFENLRRKYHLEGKEIDPSALLQNALSQLFEEK